MERKDSKDLNVDIDPKGAPIRAKATDEQYYRHVSARGQRDFFAKEANFCFIYASVSIAYLVSYRVLV
jgi:hypothetical protein